MKPLNLNSVELPATQGPAAPKAPEAVDGQDFSQKLADAIHQVDQLQTDADAEASKLGGGAGNLHETMMALEKADVAMRVAMKVRNKLVDAYNEVMRMPV